MEKIMQITKKIKYKELGEGLKELRGEMTLKQLAARLHLTTSHICEMEKGYKMPSLNVVDRYARNLGVKIDLVLGDEL